MHRGVIATAAAVAVVVALLPVAASAAAQPPTIPPAIATLDGQQIDLSSGWGEAQACLVLSARGIAECFRSRGELLAREAQIETQLATSPSTALASCSTPLRLYADGSYGGRELDFYDRGYWQNLSTWSFDNQLSSYRVGSCGVYLADGANGGGSWYPGDTSAGHNEPTMLSGWNDRISSIYIQ